MMVDINWGNFRAKFNGRENDEFERLSYHLFCWEHKKPLGIFRFKNQTGIETEPIFKGTVGFQSKFYDASLSQNKDDIISSLTKAKRENKNLNTVLFYLNQEFSESNFKGKKDPKYKIEIEAEAQKLALVVEWRVPSHFEQQLSLPENHYLAEYFFSLEKGTVDFLADIKSHSDSILEYIHTSINYRGSKIIIDRSDVIKDFLEKIQTTPITFVAGDGGCGKTALIKQVYLRLKSIPFYVFKANEFNVKNIRDLFSKYVNGSLQNFITVHKDEASKFVVIDSAENLSDLDDLEAINEFLTLLLKNKWNVIFTTRNTYLDDLRAQTHIYFQVNFETFQINNLKKGELEKLAADNGFLIPSDIRISNLIQNLFYLNEYLLNYSDKNVDYETFKLDLWTKKILGSDKRANVHLQRESCFLEITKEKCNKGLFFINLEKKCDKSVLEKLEKAEIIKYDPTNSGYFITHDIYEEWALDRILNNTWLSSNNAKEFLDNIGTSLPIRRAFRKWLSDKINCDITDIVEFIDDVHISEKIESYWKNELLVSILLSEYSGNFIFQYEKEILSNNFSLLRQIVFLLEIGCKELDESLGQLSQDFIWTKPKGDGWKSVIKLIYKNITAFGSNDIDFLLPILKSWSEYFQKGETTRLVSLIALHFYKDNDRYFKHNEELIVIFLKGALEVKLELEEILNLVLSNKQISHSESPYCELYEILLNKPTKCLAAYSASPQKILNLCSLFWKAEADHDVDEYYKSIKIEDNYSIANYREYFPSSAYQTPLYWLLKASPRKSVDFIIEFVNFAVNNYVKSNVDFTEEIDIIVNGKKITQYISSSIWMMYRGAGSPVTPYLLQSVHMALEKFLLELADNLNPNEIEPFLIEMIQKSKSASITAVINSVALAYPDDFFNIVKILCSSLKIMLYDRIRCYQGEYEAQSVSSIGMGFNPSTRIYENERQQSNSLDHRKKSLEFIALKYQVFKSDDVDEKQRLLRQNQLWEIWDSFVNIEDNTLKLVLARVDSRKMQLNYREDKGIVEFLPEIDKDLQEFTEKSSEEYNERTKYLALELWARYKWDQDLSSENYPQYDNNPESVLKVTREICKLLQSKNDQYIHIRSIPSYTCAILLRDFSNHIDQNERVFCRDVLLHYGSAILKSNYMPQISDGVEQAIQMLPKLIQLFPDNKDDFTLLLLITLSNEYSLGNYKRICDYALEAIKRDLWLSSEINFNSILLAYLKFKPIIDQYFLKARTSHDLKEPIVIFIENHQKDLTIKAYEKLTFDDLDFKSMSHALLTTVLEIIPNDTQEKLHLKLFEEILPRLCKIFFADKKYNDVSYTDTSRFFKSCSRIILYRELSQIKDFLKPFLDEFSCSEKQNRFFEEFICVQNSEERYEQFWEAWEAYYDKCVSLFTERVNRNTSQIIHTYCFAYKYWNSEIQEWHSLKSEKIYFFQKIVRDIGSHPCVLDSIVQLLNTVGSKFTDSGINWVSAMIEKKNYQNNKLEENTVYYLAKFARRYTYNNRSKIKFDAKCKRKILFILDFLVELGSVDAYLLREDIL